jgi:hypothetical protein
MVVAAPPPAAGRGALLSSINGFNKGGLKKAKTVDKSAPVVSKDSGGGGGGGGGGRGGSAASSGGGTLRFRFRVLVLFVLCLVEEG